MKTVFMVEDEELLTELFAEYVQMVPEVNYLGSCGDGRVALERVLELKPDVIILDIRLPEVNGLEMMMLLREKLPQAKLLIFSGSVDAHSVKTALKADADGFIEKALGLEELNKAIRAVLRDEKYYTSGAAEYVKKLQAN